MARKRKGAEVAPARDPFKEDFRLFLWLVWKHLGLPEPTPAQYEIAYFMQHGFPNAWNPITGRHDIVMAFRGVGKSYMAAAYVCWRLYCDPVDEKILVVSASSNKAKEFVSQAKGLILSMEILAHLRPRPDQRDSFDRFDVNGASLAQSPSLRAAGITSQIVGSRATVVVADDVEVVENSKTEDSRQSLLRSVSEFESIKVPARTLEDGTVLKGAGDILFLGTPQTAESVYNVLIKEQGYSCFCVPARYPAPEKRENYTLELHDKRKVEILAPFVRDALDADAKLAGRPVDPKRFSDEDLITREAKGRSYFALQFQLDTTLSDAERYPLKQNDLIVFPCNPFKAPITIQWGRHSDGINVREDIPNVGFAGDRFLGPLFVDKEWRDYQASVLFVDPAGRGKDETAWTVIKAIQGMMWAVKVGGHQGDVNEAMLKIAHDAKQYSVNVIEIEPNFAPGVWISAFQPVLYKVWPGVNGNPGGCTVVESEWARGQKEARIIDTLEPVMNMHRLVVDESVAQDEVLMYQLTHLTRDRGSLSHDDRIDSLAGAVAAMQRHLEIDIGQARQSLISEELDEQLADFVETCSGWGTTFRTGRSRTDKKNRRVWQSGPLVGNWN